MCIRDRSIKEWINQPIANVGEIFLPEGGCQILLRSVKLSGLCQTAGECTDLTFSGLAVDGDGPDTVTEHQKRYAILRLFFCMYGGAKEQERICLLYTS